LLFRRGFGPHIAGVPQPAERQRFIEGGAQMGDTGAAQQVFMKRRNYFVKRRLQSRYVAYYLAILLASSVALLFFLEHRARLVLRAEMFKAHSSVFDTWSILRPEIARNTLAVVVVLIVAAVLVTLAVTWAVHRATSTVAANLGSFCAGKSRESWAAVRHPRELACLQALLATGIDAHQARIAGLHAKVDDLLVRTRALRAAHVDELGAREQVLGLRREFLEAASVLELYEKEG
jgi:hypothetical protein